MLPLGVRCINILFDARDISFLNSATRLHDLLHEEYQNLHIRDIRNSLEKPRDVPRSHKTFVLTSARFVTVTTCRVTIPAVCFRRETIFQFRRRRIETLVTGVLRAHSPSFPAHSNARTHKTGRRG